MSKSAEEKDIVGVIPESSNLERQRRREARRKKIIWGFCIFLVILMLILVAIVFSKFFFKIRTIDIEGSDRYNIQEILDISGVQQGDILFMVDEDAISERLQSELPFIISVNVKKDYPGTLKITVEETVPDFCFSVAGEYVVVSRELKILDVLRTKTHMEALYGQLIPISIPSIQNAVVGKTLEFYEARNAKFIPQLLYTLDVCEMRDKIYSIDATSRFDIELNYEDDFVIQLGDASDFETKLVFAKKIIASFEKGTKGTVCVKDPEEGFALVDKPENLIPK